MIAVQHIAAPAEIIISAAGRQDIINIIVDSFKRKARPVFVPFRRMVKYHIQNDFDAVFLQFINQPFELLALMVMLHNRAVTRVRRKKADRIVAPIVI